MGRAIRPGEEVSWNPHPGLLQGHGRKPKQAASAQNPMPNTSEPGTERAKSGKPGSRKRGAPKKA